MKKLIKQRVARGIKWLNKKYPGWIENINLNRFNIKSSKACICGQVFEDMINGFFSGFEYFYKTYSMGLATRLGFSPPVNISDYEHSRYWDLLGAEWIKQLKKLKKK